MRRPAIWPLRSAPLLAAALCAWSVPALSHPITASAVCSEEEQAEDAGLLLIRAKTLYVTPSDKRENVNVLVQDGRIRDVGPDLEAPEGAKVIDGDVVCAAFIDPWSTIGLTGEDINNSRTVASTRSFDAFDAWTNAHALNEALRAGVTTARVQAGENSAVGGLGMIVRLDPELSRDEAALSPDANVACAVGLTSRGRVTDVLDRISEVDKVLTNIESGRKYREDQVEYRHAMEEWKKAIAEKEAELDKGFKSAKKSRDKAIKEAKEKDKEFKEKTYKEDKQPKPVSFDEDKAVFARVAEGEIPLVVQVHRSSELRALLNGSRTHKRLRLIIAGGVECLPYAEELAKRNIPVIVWPTSQRENLPDEYDGHDLALAGQLEEADVSVLIGSGGSSTGSRDLPLLAGLAIGHGLDWNEAFAALTIRAARVFDLGDRLGSVEVGKDAELLVLDGDPLASTTRVRYVITGGRVAVSPE
ncbi:MAG: imidazolonepropionase-like amidohydrolase [Planctomycetota bacterium]|jgi:imidazolonepropionase-like amidohydrolase